MTNRERSFSVPRRRKRVQICGPSVSLLVRGPTNRVLLKRPSYHVERKTYKKTMLPFVVRKVLPGPLRTVLYRRVYLPGESRRRNRLLTEGVLPTQCLLPKKETRTSVI